MIGLEAQRLRVKFENVFELSRSALREESRRVFYGSHCDNAGLRSTAVGAQHQRLLLPLFRKAPLRPTSPVVAAAGRSPLLPPPPPPLPRAALPCLVRSPPWNPTSPSRIPSPQCGASKRVAWEIDDGGGRMRTEQRYDSLLRAERLERECISAKTEIKKTDAQCIIL